MKSRKDKKLEKIKEKWDIDKKIKAILRRHYQFATEAYLSANYDLDELFDHAIEEADKNGYAKGLKDLHEYLQLGIKQGREQERKRVIKEIRKMKRSYEGLYNEAPMISNMFLELTQLLDKN